MPPSIKLWTELVMQESPILSESAAELLYFRAATAWGSNQKFEIANGVGGWVNLTKLYEQFKLLSILKENHTQ
jgi:hypothetical protein